MQMIELMTKRQVTRRILPFLFAGQLVSNIDRFCVAYAVLQMKSQLGLGPQVFGLGVSLFFAGYVLFEIPSMYFMKRFGARSWLSRIMVSWGIVTCAMVFVGGPASFLLCRFLLGVAEAGWSPGVSYYVLSWFPAEERAKTMGLWVSGSLIAIVVAGPLSTALLYLHGFGLSGWQWLFLLEGLPAIGLGVAIAVLLPERPRDASWLQPAGREWLETKLADEKAALADQSDSGFFHALVSSKVWLYAVTYFFLNMGGYSLVFWLPQLTKTVFASLSTLEIGFVSTIPWLVSVAAMVIIGRNSDRAGDRRWHLTVLGISAGVLLFCAAKVAMPTASYALVSVGVACYWPFLTIFWTAPMAMLKQGETASGFALINSLGLVSGFIGPFVVGFLKAHTGSFNGSLMIFAIFFGFAGIIPLIFAKAFPRRTQKTLSKIAPANAMLGQENGNV